jgi:hypothetical protein
VRRAFDTHLEQPRQAQVLPPLPPAFLLGHLFLLLVLAQKRQPPLAQIYSRVTERLTLLSLVLRSPLTVLASLVAQPPQPLLLPRAGPRFHGSHA